MTSYSWNYQNFWMNEIFGREFDFILGEHKLRGGGSRNVWVNNIFGRNFDFVLGEEKFIGGSSRNVWG